MQYTCMVVCSCMGNLHAGDILTGGFSVVRVTFTLKHQCGPWLQSYLYITTSMWPMVTKLPLHYNINVAQGYKVTFTLQHQCGPWLQSYLYIKTSMWPMVTKLPLHYNINVAQGYKVTFTLQHQCGPGLQSYIYITTSMWPRVTKLPLHYNINVPQGYKVQFVMWVQTYLYIITSICKQYITSYDMITCFI